MDNVGTHTNPDVEDQQEKGEEHPYSCDGCGVEPIVGVLYNSKKDPHFSFCEVCQESGKFNELFRPFKKIRKHTPAQIQVNQKYPKCIGTAFLLIVLVLGIGTLAVGVRQFWGSILRSFLMPADDDWTDDDGKTQSRSFSVVWRCLPFGF